MGILTPIKPPKAERDIKQDFFVIDTETRGLSPQPKDFIFCVIYGHEYYKVCYTTDEVKQELKAARYRHKKLYAHNAEYDFSTIFGNIIRDADTSAVFNSKFIFAKYQRVTLCDSMNVLPGSVKKLGEQIGLPKLDIDESYKEGGEDIEVTPEMIEYCKRDCEIVWLSLLKAFSMTQTTSLTISSLSMYYFRRFHLKEPVFHNKHNDEFFNSYYGGRTEAFKIGPCKASVYDINSLYPFVMSEMYFPDPAKLKRMHSPSLKRLDSLLDAFEGLFCGEIEHFDNYVGYLPYKDEKTGKLMFPVGRFRATVNFNELRYALQAGAVRVIRCEYVIIGERIKSPFSGFVGDLYSKRLKAQIENEDFLSYFFKLILNSLYGKFGMREKFKEQYFESIPFDYLEKMIREKDYYLLKLFSKDRDDCYVITKSREVNNMHTTIATFASYITSRARIELLKGILSNQDNLWYCDTDSVFIDAKPKGLKQGKLLGNWKLEDKHIVEVRGLKNYTILEEDELIHIIKGIGAKARKVPVSLEELLELEHKGRLHPHLDPFVFEENKYYKTKEALRTGQTTGEPYIKRKVVSHIYEKREVNEHGETWPVKLVI